VYLDIRADLHDALALVDTQREQLMHHQRLTRNVLRARSEDVSPPIKLDTKVTATESCPECGLAIPLTYAQQANVYACAISWRTQGYDWREGRDKYLSGLCDHEAPAGAVAA